MGTRRSNQTRITITIGVIGILAIMAFVYIYNKGEKQPNPQLVSYPAEAPH